MLDRTSKLRAIITGRGNRSGLHAGFRSCFKKQSHSRMRQAGKQQIREQLAEMQTPEETSYDELDWSWDIDDRDWDLSPEEIILMEEEQQKREKRLARRRELYHARKVARQVASYEELLSALRKLDAKLEPDARIELSKRGSRLVF